MDAAEPAAVAAGRADAAAAAVNDAVASAMDASSPPVVAMELVWVSLPLRRAHRAAHGAVDDRQVVLVHAVGADGVHGWGECSALNDPGYTAEWTAGAWDCLHDRLVPAVLAGADPVAVAADLGAPMAGAAVEAALVDVVCRRRNQSLAGLLGATTAVLDRCVVVTGTDSADVAAAVAGAVDGGAAMVKLKVSPGWGADAVAAVTDRWPGLAVAVDANGSLAGHPGLLAALAGAGLAYVEQPGPAGDLAACVDAAAGLGEVAVALDESATTPAAVARALAAGAGTVVNVKPARVGGLAAAMAVVAEARRHGAGVFVGGMLETGVGRAAAVAVAAAVAPGGAWPTDLGPSAQYFTRDVTDPVVTDADGRLVVPAGPGIGVVPHEDRLAAAAVRRATVTP